MEIKDSHGRSFRTLRVSLTDVCNFGCVYCVNGEDRGERNSAGKKEKVILHYSEITNIILRLHSVLNISTVRLTGGEPTLYKDIVPFIQQLTSQGITNIKMTTNGFLLKQKAAELYSAGIKEINISLDALDSDVFARISKRNYLTSVLDGIEAALRSGISVKLNAVIMRGINEQEVLSLLEYAMEKNIQLRFLELMRMGHFFSHNFEQYYFSMKEIVDCIQQKYRVKSLSRKPSATAQHWQLQNGYVFGVIANESQPFCSDCDRLRLDSYGNIYGCLSEEKHEFVGDTISDEQLNERLKLALTHKQPLKFKGSALKMIAIGG